MERLKFIDQLYDLTVPTDDQASDEPISWNDEELDVNIVRRGDMIDFFVHPDHEQFLRKVLGFNKDRIKDATSANLGPLYMGEREGRSWLRLRRPMLLVQILDLKVGR